MVCFINFEFDKRFLFSLCREKLRDVVFFLPDNSARPKYEGAQTDEVKYTRVYLIGLSALLTKTSRPLMD